MKDLLIGMVVGVVTGYVLRKMEDDGKFRCLHANLHHLASKAKEEAMNKQLIKKPRNQGII